MSLCSLEVFRRYGGAVASMALEALLRLGALDEILLAVRSGTGLALRISTYSIWLEAGQVPSSRSDWHIDRTGGIRGAGADERYDASDTTRRRSFALTCLFAPDGDGRDRDTLDTASTEFVTRPSAIDLPDGWTTTGQVGRRIEAWRSAGCHSEPCGNASAVSFSARAVHRPGLARVAGWRFLLRVGAYETSTSPYQDHVTVCNPFCTRSEPGFLLRPVGGKDPVAPRSRWSLPAHDSRGIRSLFRSSGLRPDPAAAARAADRVRDAL
ncbi:hypothetical protein ACRYCC_42540 [Actinomadura scrupuli]|uniref:hypothetical protein n=1 Tax=Actinomadura scrupuli TaxID=559629 RepID=UPI003D9923B9